MSMICRFSLVTVWECLHQCQQEVGRQVVNDGPNLANVVCERPPRARHKDKIMIVVQVVCLQETTTRDGHRRLTCLQNCSKTTFKSCKVCHSTGFFFFSQSLEAQLELRQFSAYSRTAKTKLDASQLSSQLDKSLHNLLFHHFKNEPRLNYLQLTYNVVSIETIEG